MQSTRNQDFLVLVFDFAETSPKASRVRSSLTTNVLALGARQVYLEGETNLRPPGY